MLLIHLVAITFAFHQVQSAFYFPDLQTTLLEHILVDNWGAYASNFSSEITPCSRYVTETGDAALNSGRTTAAQWLRVMFHDVVTANVTAGTGGIDASIGFETARGENSGSAFNDSFTFWRPFVNDAVSMADLLALGTVMSTGLCGGVKMPYRAGRVDAVAARTTTGVPAPETGLDETLGFFERAGFCHEDAIAFTACGHTMGSVHHGGFPDVVDASAVSPENTNGGVNFDSTRGAFDPLIVQETERRPASYDEQCHHSVGLAAIRKRQQRHDDLSLAQGSGFLVNCAEVFTRAIDTVPSGVQLGAPIDPMVVKPINITFDIGPSGDILLSGKVRVLTSLNAPAPTSIRLTIDGETSELPAEAVPGISIFGTTTYFQVPAGGVISNDASSFSIAAPGLDSQSFPIRSQVFIVPSETLLAGTALSVAVAASNIECAAVSVNIAVPVKQPGTLAPKIMKTVVPRSGTPKRGIKRRDLRCDFATSLIDLPTGAVVVTTLMAGKVVDTLLVNGRTAGW